MKITEIVTKTVDREEEVAIVCDWCGARRERGSWACVGPRFDVLSGDTDEFRLEWVTGCGYPEGGNTTTKHVDLCQDCRPKFWELLKREGIKCSETEVEW